MFIKRTKVQFLLMSDIKWKIRRIDLFSFDVLFLISIIGGDKNKKAAQASGKKDIEVTTR